MTNSDLTSWFAAKVKPAHEGVYQRQGDGTRYACWNGRRWNQEAATPMAAARSRAGGTQDAPWRGLSAPSGAPCGTCGGHTIVDRGHHADTGADLLDECPDC